MAPTLTLIDGFEYGIAPFLTTTIGGAGICTSISNSANITCDASVKRSGGFSLKILQSSTVVVRFVKTLTASKTNVGALYFRCDAAPSTAAEILRFAGGGALIIRLDATGTMSVLYSGGAAQTTAGSVCDSAWHLLDFYNDSTTGTATCQWKVDGVTQTNATRVTASADQTTLSIGSSATSADFTHYFDDLVMSQTPGDYPIGSTTVPHSVLMSKPTGDGTHVAGTNTIEDNAGTDIASPNAFPILDNWPPDTAAYIRQATVDTTAYAEVTFANHDAGIGTIWDVTPMVAFTSSTNAVNEGAAIVSVDSFTTPLEVYGTSAARTNYQTAATTSISYKINNTSTAQGVLARPGATWDLTSFDALKGRVGHSNDVTGNPRWLGLMVQYAGTAAGLSTGDTTFVGTIPI